jgi:murein DD-endopeptidase MepM/ murein hydrolase activator NlpD
MISEKTFAGELAEFIRFLAGYIKLRLHGWGTSFEHIKDIIVAFLVVKRGKYSQSFLNTSFFLLVGAILVAGPIIIENNPFIADYFQNQEASTQSVLATDLSDLSVQTTISNKPRAEIREYKVKSGDTLASIADQFDISVDSIKWENNLKGNTIKPGQTVRILPVSGVAHKVKSGESIYSIAKRYGVDAQAIVNFPFNEFEDLDTFALNVGQTLIVPGGTPPAEKPTLVRGKAPQRVNIVAGQPGSGRFIWPTTGSVSQYPVYYHMALDIANRSLPPIIASDTGTVSFSGCVGYGYGCHVIIDHGNGFQTLYGHMSRIDVNAGQNVSQGQQIGILGSTGRSTGPHLHFEIRKGGVLQNPLGYLQ